MLSTVGSLGDLFPYLAIARELRSRGHHSLLAGSARYRSIVQAEGVPFHEARPDLSDFERQPEWSRMAVDPRRGSEHIIRRMVLPYLQESYEDLRAVVRGADLVVAHPFAYAAKLAAEKLGVPWVVGALQPAIFLSSFDPPALSRPFFADSVFRLGRPLSALLVASIKLVMRGWAAPLREMRRRLDLPGRRIDPLVEGQFSERLNLALFSPLIARPQPDWPPGTVVTGFPHLEEDPSRSGAAEAVGASVTPALARFLDRGEPPLIFTLGSLAVLSPDSFFSVSARAAREFGRRAVLLVGESGLGDLRALASDELYVGGYEPHAALFPRAAAVVNQGGIGTIAHALRAGKPMLVAPSTNDQPDNARRVERLGVARVLPRAGYRVDRLVFELDRLLTTPEYATRAKELADLLARERGAQAACDALERLLEGL